MSRIIYDDNFISRNKLVPGLVYVVKDGRLMMYLGVTNKSELAFYMMASAYLQYFDYGEKLTFGNYEWQVLGLIQICNNSINHKADVSCVITYKTMPKIHGVFPKVDYRQQYKLWWIQSFDGVTDAGIPNLASITNSKIDAGFVKAKDLVPGEIYYSGTGWRSTFVFLGRTTDKKYVWKFISNANRLITNTYTEIRDDIEVTKNNKKVKRLADALTDEHAYLGSGSEELLKLGFKVDMSRISQAVLDSIALKSSSSQHYLRYHQIEGY